jgi:uncharacterized protein YabE (DUF348 family)/3D (Asp-Asp-Asp) domain-containing protein
MRTAFAGFASRAPRRKKRGPARGAQQGEPRARRQAGIPWGGLALALCLVASVAFFMYSLKAPDSRVTVTLKEDDLITTYRVQPRSVDGFLRETGITLREGDILSQDKQAELAEGMEIVITRAYPVAVKSNGTAHVLHLTSGTVGDALRRANVSYTAGDELSELPFENLEPGMEITHTAVDIAYAVRYKTLEYDEIVIKDDKQYEDYKKVEVVGANGEKQITQRITVKDGVEVSREVVDQTITSPAVDKVTRIGTKIKYQTNYVGETRRWREAPVDGENGWKKMVVDKITAYCTGTRTATGTKPALGTIAVNPYYITYRTEIYVKGYGFGVARDTGAFRNYKNSRGEPMNQLDLWFNTEKEARRWGTKYNVTIWVKKR